MRTLRSTINRYILLLAFVSVTVMLSIIVLIQLKTEQNLAYERSTATFQQIEQILDENRLELDEIQGEYAQTCLNNAETIARIIEGEPELIYDVEELKELAGIVGVDEIHFFDAAGRIFAGTHPKYFDLTFDSGEQMMFFKPMLKDKSLRLVQDITANTAEGKPMQYSAIWSRKGDVIVQVGMEPTKVMKVRAKNELSYIFSLFTVNPEVIYCAVDAESGEIVGATVTENVGETLDKVGLTKEDLASHPKGFFAEVDGVYSFCVFKRVDENYIGRIVSASELYRRVPMTVFQLTACLAVIVLILLSAIAASMNKLVVEKLRIINGKLHSIAMGNRDEEIDVQDTFEFSELSNYLNSMIRSFLSNNKKMSYVLSKTNIRIGVYEYNHHMKRVYFTEYLPELLGVDVKGMERLASDYGTFNAFLEKLRETPLPGEPGVYRQQSGRYVKLEESRGQDEVFGVVIDVTDDIRRMRRIELERDMDPLTGLYNRRGMDIRLERLFQEPEKLGHSAFVMIDADGLKAVNDTFGHEKGDIYLKRTSELLRSYLPETGVASRQGGDEFLLFLYQYGDEVGLVRALKALEEARDRASAELDGTLRVPIRFSMGYCLTREQAGYQDAIKEADRRMYANKRERKSASVPGESALRSTDRA